MVTAAQPSSDEHWKALLAHLPAETERLAHEHEVIDAQWPNAKVHDAAALLRFIVLCVCADLSLRQTASLIAEAGGPCLAPVWLRRRMRRAQPSLAALVELMIADVVADATPESWAGYEMDSLDATTVSGPGAEGSDARLHGVLRLHDLRVRDVCVAGASRDETFRQLVCEANTLVIAYRGDANAPVILRVVDHRADVLVRVNRGALPLAMPPDKVIDVVAWCRGVEDNIPYERRAVISHATGIGTARRERRLEGRLINVNYFGRQRQLLWPVRTMRFTACLRLRCRRRRDRRAAAVTP